MALTLSEAIRLGAMLRPQGFGDLFQFSYPDLTVKTCALGAAYEAAGIMSIDSDRDATGWPKLTRGAFPILDLLLERGCPACRKLGTDKLAFVVTHLNDEHRWTREAIADWIATLEPQPEPELQSEFVPVLAHPAVREGR